MRWTGKCPDCGEWNTLTEEVYQESKTESHRTPLSAIQPQKLSDIRAEDIRRLPINIGELSRVLGGGIVPGSLVLIGGEPGIGKCVTADTRVLDPLSGAYLPITEWANPSRPVLSLQVDSQKLEPSHVAAFFERGVQPIVELKTALGRTLRCTPSHPLLTPQGWQPVKELAPGNYIGSPRALPYFGTQSMPEAQVKLIAYLLSDGSAQSAITVTNALPEVAQDLEEIATAFHVCLRKYPKPHSSAVQYRFMSINPTAATRHKTRAVFTDALWTAKSSSTISWQEWARRANTSASLLNQWRRGQCVPDADALHRLEEAIGEPIASHAQQARMLAEMTTPVARFAAEMNIRYTCAAEKSVPGPVFCLPRRQLALFLNRLFSCDGSVYVDAHGQPGVSYSTISPRLAADVQHLLLRFGLVATLRKKKANVNGKPYVAYEVVLLGIAEVQQFLNEIGILGRDQARAYIATLEPAQRPSTQRDMIPTGAGFWQHIQTVAGNKPFAHIAQESGVTFKNRRHERPLTRFTVQAIATSLHDPQLIALAQGDVFWDRIISITPAGHEAVYDISVPGNACFVGNDLIVHNSTLLLQAAVSVAQTSGTTLYVSGEESNQQLKMRAERLGVGDSDLYLLTDTNLDNLIYQIETMHPKLAIIDSIQTMYIDSVASSAGTVSQVRECAQRLQALAKSTDIPVFIVGHVTKEGSIAGPKVLEHIVDTVLQLEGDRFHALRLLRSMKNRFGATSEVGVFEMVGNGMTEVSNPSEAFLAERMKNAPGSSIAVTMEGTRPLLVEVQALTSVTQNPMPRRTANGFDYNRLFILLAVLGKRVGVRLHDQDVFINIVGGMSIDEPAADLAVATAIASASKGIPVPVDMAIIGEIGLSGEVRSVGQIGARLNEAAKLGFRRCIVPKTARPVESPAETLQLIPARSLGEALDSALGN
jgi:DNA repair protein RadA/Sms